jgi:hypothetical protein
MTTIAPNPHSPYADADPETRHIFPSPIFFPTPSPGVLALTACEGMAVVPEDLVETEPGAPLPDGLCPACVAVVQGGRAPKRPSSECRECEAATYHGELCALCRQTKHETWWPTRGEDQPDARITLRRDQLAALLAHHADVLAAQLRTGYFRDAWIAAERLDAHANALTADEETPAVAELLDSMLSFDPEAVATTQRAANLGEECGKCRRPFDPADTRFDGHARHRETPYCRGCVDRCRDNEIADHRCVICAPADVKGE